jgi:plastocyanin
MVQVARRSSFAFVLLFALLAAFAASRTDAASTRNVAMENNVFNPANVTINQGDTVLWNRTGTNPHNSTGNAPLNLWSSGTVPSGGTFPFVFNAAGTYPYRCTFHAGIGMTGRVAVRLKGSTPTGSVGTRFTVTVATGNASSPFVYDVQWKQPGGAFTTFKRGITTKSVSFNSTGKAPGVYEFRSRLRNTSTGAASGWSPVRQITVDP